MISQSQLAQLSSSVQALQVATARLAAYTGGRDARSYYAAPATRQVQRTSYPVTTAAAGAQLVQARPATMATRARTSAGSAYTTAQAAARTVVRGAGTAASTAATTARSTVGLATSRLRSVWTSHISQYRNQYNPNGPAMAPNCGPASVTMALRLVGLDIPGFNGQRDQRVLDKARIIATGKNDTRVGTTDTELERVITASGGKFSESTNFSTLTSWVKQGVPVIMAGNPSQAWNKRISANQVYPFNGGHWVTVSGFDSSKNAYVVNDPLSAIGPIYVSERELATYFAPGKLGIGVYR